MGSRLSRPGLMLPEAAALAVQRITAARLRAHVGVLSSDRFEGRAPGSRGDGAARVWIAERLRELGFAPAGPDGSWEQPFEVVGMTTRMPPIWRFSSLAGARPAQVLDLAWGADFMAECGVQRPSVSVKDAEVVFVGYGIHAPEQGWDDYEDVDVTGKILLVLNNDPDWDPELFDGKRRTYYGRWTYKYEEAARRGAAGAIILHTTESAGYPWEVVHNSWQGEQFDLPQRGEPRTLVRGWVTEGAGGKLAALGGQDLERLIAGARRRDFRPVPLGVRTSVELETAMQRTRTANVLGLLEGSDPEHSGEVVVLTAHHDHLGIGEPDDTGDEIYNGARDNASGVAMVLSVAEAFSALDRRPRRSVLALLVGAEEHGLLGSEYYARHPTFSPERIAANMNFELGNIWGRTRDVVIHGKGKTDIDALVAAAADYQGRRVVDELDPDAGWFYRSDQFSFARVGVPSIWFESGRDFVDRPPGWGDEVHRRWIAERYHRPTDQLDADWNFDGMVEDAQLAFWVAASLATNPRMPAWSEGVSYGRLRHRKSSDDAGVVDEVPNGRAGR